MNLPMIFSKLGLWGKRHSPELLIAGGILSAAASVGLGIYATTKLNKVVKPYNDKIDEIKKNLNDDNKIQNNEVDVKQLKKELTTTYIKASLKITALYLPSVLCFGSSVCCVLGSHKIMRGRNLALAAACSTLEQSYAAYRARVKKEFGEEVEEKLFNNVTKEKVEVIDPKTGKTKTKTIEVENPSDDNWKVIFDNGNYCWENNALLNFEYLMNKQDFLNDKLMRKGYMFLNEVYEELGYTTAMLGYKKARASHILGWIYDPKDTTRNSYISFGLTQPGTRVPLPRVAEQIQNNFPSFALSFNVDGDILTGEYGKETFMRHAKEVG